MTSASLDPLLSVFEDAADAQESDATRPVCPRMRRVA